jgi:hypothetical protein
MTPTPTCAVCGARPGTIRDFAQRDGAWVEADVCRECLNARRPSAVLPLLGALSGVALLAGAMFASERMNRGSAAEAPPPPATPREWAKRLRGTSTPTLEAFSRDLTAAAKAGELDPVIGRDTEVA